MNDMQEIITMEQANRLFLFLAIGGPLLGLALGSFAGVKAKAAKQGYNGILSAGYYIDLIYPASQHYKVDPLPADIDEVHLAVRRIHAVDV